MVTGMGQNIGVSVKRDSLSVGLAVGAAGVAFGAVAVADHFTVAQACFLSLVLFSGASQFSLVAVMSSGGSALSAIVTGAFLGGRNGLYGVRMAQILKLKGAKRALAAQITIDESTGVSIAQTNHEDQVTAFWYTGFGVFVFWNLFTLLGALGAKAIGDTSAWGLDVASPAIFCAVLFPRLKERKLLIASVLAFIWALSITEVVPAGVPKSCYLVFVVCLGD